MKRRIARRRRDDEEELGGGVKRESVGGVRGSLDEGRRSLQEDGGGGKMREDADSRMVRMMNREGVGGG